MLCSICSSSKQVILHHNKYFPIEEVIPLCRKCHWVLHSFNPIQLLAITILVEKYSEHLADAPKFYSLKRSRKARVSEGDLKLITDIVEEREIAEDIIKHWGES